MGKYTRRLHAGVALALTCFSYQASALVVEAESFQATGGSYAGFKTYDLTSGGSAINWNQVGDWADYSLQLAAGTYAVSIEAGTPLTNTAVELRLNNQIVSTTPILNTGGWDNFVEFDLTEQLIIHTAGTYTVRIQGSGTAGAWQWNADKLHFIQQAVATPSPTPTPQVTATPAPTTVVLEAEAFTSTGGTHAGFQTYTLAQGGQAINYSQTGDWVQYDVNIAAGTYAVNILAGTPLFGAGLNLFVDGLLVDSAEITNTNGWDNFTYHPISSALTISNSGVHTIRLVSAGAANAWQWNADKVTFTPLTQASPTPTPVVTAIPTATPTSTATPASTPTPVVTNTPSPTPTPMITPTPQVTTSPTAVVVEAENFSNTGGTYSGFQTYTSASGLGAINYNQAGDYADYSVHLVAGNYSVSLSAATPLTGTAVEFFVDGISRAVTPVANTGGWDVFRPVTVSSSVNIASTGTHTLRIMGSGAAGSWQWNADKFTLTPAGAPLGLDSREPNNSCLAGDAPQADSYKLTRVWGNAGLNNPIFITQKPGANSNDFYIVERGGLIKRISSNYGSTSTSNFINLSAAIEGGGEGGAWSMVFHPQWPTKPYVYVSYMAKTSPWESRISRFTTNAAGTTANSEKILWRLPQYEYKHKAGNLAFGPDGLLYMSVGDDGQTASVGNANQQKGSVIRIDVDGGGDNSYAIPAGNFNNNEVFAYGFRNPWRMSFDKQNGDLWVGDVGEECWEEINIVESGKNYGWPNWEGLDCGPGSCAGSNTAPEFSYHNGESCGLGSAITGGFVYRGSAMPELQGKYIFADFESGLIWSYDPASKIREKLFANAPASYPATFAQDNAGELYVIHLSFTNGALTTISKLEAMNNAGSANLPPQNMMDTGCFASIANPPVPATGVVPFGVAQKFWSDGAEKERWLALPNNSTMAIDDDGEWSLPIGGVLIKHFKWTDGRYFETRFVVRYNNGSYGFYTYEWTDQNTAVLVPAEGKSTTLSGGHVWNYPSTSDCLSCHRETSNYVLGPETRQMNIDFHYASTNRTANQFDTLNAIGMLSGNLQKLPAFPAIDNESVSLNERGESYVHVNCSSCHRGPGSMGQSQWDARYHISMANKGLCNATPTKPVTTNPNEALIKAGDHNLSSIWLRMHQRESGMMPPVGSAVADEQGTELLADWIDAMALATCQ